jgi:hypothetical protein
VFSDFNLFDEHALVAIRLIDVFEDHVCEGFTADCFDTSDLTETEAFELD